MEYSSELQRVRGFVPPQGPEEELIMRRAQDWIRVSDKRGIPVFSSFLSDREQSLVKASADKTNAHVYGFWGGYVGAQRKIFCAGECENEDYPISYLKIESDGFSKEKLTHRDYLGAMLGLNIGRESIGDILVTDAMPQIALVVVLKSKASLFIDELCEVGRTSVKVSECCVEEFLSVEIPSPVVKTCTVSSLRLDGVLASILNCSRSIATELIRAGKVQINHVSVTKCDAPVYEGDVFSIRYKGKYCLENIAGKSKKDRIFIKFYKFE